MSWAIEDWSELGSAATVVTAGVAMVSAGFALGQFSGQAKLAREMRATEAWDGYLRLCVDKPELSSNAAFQRTFGREPNVDYEANAKEDEQYLWFLSVLLNACEQVLFNAPRWRKWETAIEDQIGFHSETLRRVWYGGNIGDTVLHRWDLHYSERLKPIVARVVGPPSGGRH